MMGKQPQRQAKLFYYPLSLEDRIPHDHLLRKIHMDGSLIDANASTNSVCKGSNGAESSDFGP